MPAFWTVDDFINSRCGQGQDCADTLQELHDLLLRGKMELTGWRWAWNARGEEFWQLGAEDQSETREVVPVLELVDMKFVRDHGGRFILIPHNHNFAPKPPAAVPNEVDQLQYWSEPLLYIGGVTWGKISGWKDLRFRADDILSNPQVEVPKQSKIGAVRNYIAEKYQGRIPAGVTDKAIARDFFLEKKIEVHPKTVERARTTKKT